MKLKKLLRWRLVFLVAFFSGCGLEDALREVDASVEVTMKQYLHEINSTQNAILSGSGEVIELVKRLEKTLDTVDDHLFYSVPYITRELTNSLQLVSLCSIEYLRLQAVYLLDQMIEEIMTGQVSSRPKYPAICSSNPIVVSLDAPIELRRTIQFVGFNLEPNRDSITVGLVPINGATLWLKGIIRFQGLFSFVLDISGLTDEQLARYSYITVVHNGKKSLFELPILPKIPKPKESKTMPSRAPIGYVVPAHVYGNRDFSGHGPKGYVNVEFSLRRNKLYARIFMYARETCCDYTTVIGYGPEYTLFECPSGWAIKQVNLPGFTMTPSMATRIYTTGFDDTNGALANKPFPTPIGQITVVGDQHGEEAGSRTRADVQFSSFSVIIEKP